MAARKVDAPSSSTDASPSPCGYHVFLSFRGETRKSFTDFLHDALERAGFRTFRDNNDIRRGKSIEAEIRRGIEESQLSLIVLSKGYASSEWCLDELVMIMERQRNGRCLVLPVFYDVDPDLVSDQTHCYAEALARHQEKFEEDRVEGWKKALRDVAELAGMVLGDRHQVPLVQEVVETVKKLLANTELHGASELVAELPCDATIGTEAKFNEIWNCLQEKDVGIIGLYGMGGVGKTTLLTQIRNKLVDSFNKPLVIWIVVGKNSNLEKIQTDIGKEIGILQGSIDEKREYIYNRLLKKKFVLFIDDIWERIKLSEIGIPPREKLDGSKIIFTTRSLKICGEMLAQKKIRVETLEWKHAWELFKRYVSEDIILDDPEIFPLAKRVAKTCGGLPIALITIGRAMSYKTEPWEWNHAIEILKQPALHLQNSEAEVLNEMEVEVFSLLRFSFDNLPNDRVKSCFLYCALYPDDYSIHKKILVNKWFWEDTWISGNVSKVQNEVYSVINTLVRSCLLEEKGEFVKLHDVIRDMALWIERENALVMARMELTEAPADEKWEEVRRLSLMFNKIGKLTQVPKCPKLVTLFLNCNRNLNEINEDFFKFMGGLTILNLSWTSIDKLPRSTINLVSLKSLDISYTQIEELPAEFARLDKLKFLGLRGLNVKVKKSEKVISCLSSLQIISMLNCVYHYQGNETNRTGKEEEERVDGEMLVEELLCLKHLNALDITIRCFSTLKRFLSDHRLMSITEGICFWGFKGVKSLNLCFLVNMKVLDYLFIRECGFEEILAIGSRDQLSDINFNCLREVELFGCGHLRDMTWLILASNLTTLWAVSCPKLEEIISDEVVDKRCRNLKPFSKLSVLRLDELPQLNCIYSAALPFLRLAFFYVAKCPLLKKLPLDSNSKDGCKIRLEAEEEWWEGIEWEDDVTKAALLPRFRLVLL